MSGKKSVRLNKLVKEFNVSIDRIYSFLELKGIDDLIDVQEVCSDSDSLWVKSTAKNAIRS